MSDTFGNSRSQTSGRRPSSRRTSWRSLFDRPESILALTFAALIFAGTVLLSLPAARADADITPWDALFTATSAVCVTGLTTVDTATAWSRFGQGVILALIQLGGLGIMTFGAVAAYLLHLRLSFAGQAAWRVALFEGQGRGDLRRALYGILLMTFVLEASGAWLLLQELQATPTPRGGTFEALFLAVSAFCNAGFSVYSHNVAGFSDSRLILSTIMLLVVAGGLGYVVLLEIALRTWCRIRRRPAPSVRWSLHARVVLTSSGLLIVGGAALLLIFGCHAPNDGWSARIMHALFQSVCARTAGFNTVDIGALPVASLLILIALMFIGGSPVSCAGGIKTTTTVVWLARIAARLASREDVTVAGRRLPQDIVRRGTLVVSVALLWNLLGVLILTVTEGAGEQVRFEHIIFEQVSAFGTVGLSAGLGSSRQCSLGVWDRSRSPWRSCLHRA